MLISTGENVHVVPCIRHLKFIYCFCMLNWFEKMWSIFQKQKDIYPEIDLQAEDLEIDRSKYKIIVHCKNQSNFVHVMLQYFDSLTAWQVS